MRCHLTVFAEVCHCVETGENLALVEVVVHWHKREVGVAKPCVENSFAPEFVMTQLAVLMIQIPSLFKDLYAVQGCSGQRVISWIDIIEHIQAFCDVILRE